jgi:phosphoglycerate dehydrogenase-like enzyme
MTIPVVAVIPALVRSLLEPHLPDWVDARWFASKQEAMALAPLAEIGWFDMYDKADMAAAIRSASRMRWLNSIFAGVDAMPLAELQQRQIRLTNGAGINAITIAEYVVMGMLTIAKGYRDVVRAQDRREWLKDSPGKVELFGSRALVLGFGAIGKLVQERLQAFGVDVSVVRRTPDASGKTLAPTEWRARLGEFDWVILAVPATAETARMISAAELAAMKPGAVLINVARGTVVDQAALVGALRERRLGAALLDVTDPEPLPPDHPLWSLDNAHITMHLSGRAQSLMFQRSAQRFLDNLQRYRSGEPMLHQVDLAQGY